MCVCSGPFADSTRHFLQVKGHSMTQIPSLSQIRPRFQHPLRIQRLFSTSVIYSSPCRGRKKAEVATLSVERASSSNKQYRSRSVSRHFKPARNSCEHQVRKVREASRFPRPSSTCGPTSVSSPPRHFWSPMEGRIPPPRRATIVSTSPSFPPSRVTRGFLNPLYAHRLRRVRHWRRRLLNRTCLKPQRKSGRFSKNPSKHTPVQIYKNRGTQKIS